MGKRAIYSAFFVIGVLCGGNLANFASGENLQTPCRKAWEIVLRTLVLRGNFDRYMTAWYNQGGNSFMHKHWMKPHESTKVYPCGINLTKFTQFQSSQWESSGFCVVSSVMRKNHPGAIQVLPVSLLLHTVNWDFQPHPPSRSYAGNVNLWSEHPGLQSHVERGREGKKSKKEGRERHHTTHMALSSDIDTFIEPQQLVK